MVRGSALALGGATRGGLRGVAEERLEPLDRLPPLGDVGVDQSAQVQVLDVCPQGVVEGPVAAGWHCPGVAARFVTGSQPEASQVTSDRRSVDA